MKKAYTFDDVLIIPKFSNINSRRDVDLTNSFGLKLPIISSNMKDITESKMAHAMVSQGAIGALHRFCTIEQNIEMYNKSPKESYVSIGVNDMERFLALWNESANNFIIDVANGASTQVIETTNHIKNLYSSVNLIVGNFASVDSVKEFLNQCKYKPNGIKVGIGSGSICVTRMKTGVGYPQFSAILEIRKWLDDNGYSGIKVIADGGVRTPGDIAKALAAGADAVMLGSMLAGTDETSGAEWLDSKFNVTHKTYSGSAANSYSSGWKTNEGIEAKVPYKGKVENVLKDIEGGLRSAFTYVNAKTLTEFRNNVEFVEVTSNTVRENGAHVQGEITKQ